ncbi:uncharacterized protein LOC111270965 isoform X1 [Varroa jacobsoni]|uniref:uncharacterized protein LOC111270965 isoform X1 n=1 Tax=Varroa jacobsoni TaxID=62625 RepID=UPI000BF79C59|nr:uncharacterized protein LOC111270965 isoform X1 [Varroa jacobsoni]
MGKPAKPKAKTAQVDVPSTNKIGKIYKNTVRKVKKTQLNKGKQNASKTSATNVIGHVSGFTVTRISPRAKKTLETAGGDAQLSREPCTSTKHVTFAESPNIRENKADTVKAVGKVTAAASQSTISRLAARTFSARGSPSIESPINEADAHLPKKRKKATSVHIEDADVRKSTTAIRRISVDSTPRRIFETPKLQNSLEKSDSHSDSANVSNYRRRVYAKGTPCGNLLCIDPLDDEDDQLNGFAVENAMENPEVVVGKMSLEKKFYEDPLEACATSSETLCPSGSSRSATSLRRTLSPSSGSSFRKIDSEKRYSLPVAADEIEMPNAFSKIKPTLWTKQDLSANTRIVRPNFQQDEQRIALEMVSTNSATPFAEAICAPAKYDLVGNGDYAPTSMMEADKADTSPVTRWSSEADSKWAALTAIEPHIDISSDTKVMQECPERVSKNYKLNNCYQGRQPKQNFPENSPSSEIENNKHSDSPLGSHSAVKIPKKHERRPSFIVPPADQQLRSGANGPEVGSIDHLDIMAAGTIKAESYCDATEEVELEDRSRTLNDISTDGDVYDDHGERTLNESLANLPPDEDEKQPRLSDNPSDPTSEIDLKLEEPTEEDHATLQPVGQQVGLAVERSPGKNAGAMAEGTRNDEDLMSPGSPANFLAARPESDIVESTPDHIANILTNNSDVFSRVRMDLSDDEVRKTTHSIVDQVVKLDEYEHSHSVSMEPKVIHQARHTTLSEIMQVADSKPSVSSEAACMTSEFSHSSKMVDVFKQRRSQIILDEEEPMETSVLLTPVVSGNNMRVEQDSPLSRTNTGILKVPGASSQADISSASQISNPLTVKALIHVIEASENQEKSKKDASSFVIACDYSSTENKSTKKLSTKASYGTKPNEDIEETFPTESSASKSCESEEPIEEVQPAKNIDLESILNSPDSIVSSEATSDSGPLNKNEVQVALTKSKATLDNEDDEDSESDSSSDQLSKVLNVTEKHSKTRTEKAGSMVTELSTQDENTEQDVLTSPLDSLNRSENPRKDDTSIGAFGLNEGTAESTVESEIVGTSIKGKVDTEKPICDSPQDSSAVTNEVEPGSGSEKLHKIAEELRSETATKALPHQETVRNELIEEHSARAYVNADPPKQSVIKKALREDSVAVDSAPRLVDEKGSLRKMRAQVLENDETSPEKKNVNPLKDEETAVTGVVADETPANVDTEVETTYLTPRQPPRVTRSTRSKARTPALAKTPSTSTASERSYQVSQTDAEPPGSLEQMTPSTTKLTSKAKATPSSTRNSKVNDDNAVVREPSNKIKEPTRAARASRIPARSGAALAVNTVETADGPMTPRRSARHAKAAALLPTAEGNGARKNTSKRESHNVTRSKK